jgi:hypothetical protein
MTKPKKKTGSPVIYTRGHALAKEQKDMLLDLLLFPDEVDLQEMGPKTRHKVSGKAVLAIGKIENILGAYNGLVGALDDEPRAADYRRDLGYVRKKSYQLLHDIIDLNQWMVDALTVEGCDANEVVLALGKLVDSAGLAIDKMGVGDSRGGTSGNALKMLANYLANIFEEHYMGEPADKPKGRALPDRERAKIDFIKLALSCADIPHPNNIRPLLAADSKAA